MWRWYLGPLVPGLVVFWTGVALAPSTDLPPWGQAAVGIVGIGVAALVFFAIGAANAKAAKSLDEEIKALDQVRKG